MKKKNKVLAIILARSGSTRLKNKVFLKIGKKTILEIFINRLKKSKLIDDFIIATTKKSQDNKIAKLASKLNIKLFRGSENNVLKRFYQAMKLSKINPELIVRANADNFLVMPNILDHEIKLMLKNLDYDLSTPFDKNFCPFGYSLVIFRNKTVKKIYSKAKNKKYLEHIENFCFDNENQFKILRPVHKKSLKMPNLKLSLDTLSDFKLMKKIFLKISKSKLEKQPKLIIDIIKKNVK